MGTMLKMTDGFGKVRTIGLLNGQTLRMRRNKERHLYHKLNAWCFDKDAFDAHPEVLIFIIEEESGGRYLVPREAFDLYAEVINFAGHGDQLALPLEHWEYFEEQGEGQ